MLSFLYLLKLKTDANLSNVQKSKEKKGKGVLNLTLFVSFYVKKLLEAENFVGISCTQHLYSMGIVFKKFRFMG